jgi:hypothetical protein
MLHKFMKKPFCLTLIFLHETTYRLCYLISAVIAFYSFWILYFHYDIPHPWVCSAKDLLNSNELFQFFRTFDVEGTEYLIIIHVI